MALLEDVIGEWSWGTGSLVGLGALVLAPTVLPAVGAVIRPVVKGLVWGTLAVTANARELMAEAGEQLSDIYAEAKHDYEQGHSQQSTPASPASPTTGANSRIVTPTGEPAPHATAGEDSGIVTPTGEPTSSTAENEALIVTPTGEPATKAPRRR